MGGMITVIVMILVASVAATYFIVTTAFELLSRV